MAIATVPLTDTFDQWRIKFNSLVTEHNANISPEALATLTTDDQTTIVAAVNEIHAAMADTENPTTFTEIVTFEDDIVMDGGEVLLDTGTAGAPSLAFSSDTNTGIYLGGANEMRVSTNGSDAIIIGATGSTFQKDLSFYAGLNIALAGNFTITNSLSNVILDQDGVALSPGSVENADIGDEEIQNTKLNIRQAPDQLGVSGSRNIDYSTGDWFHIQASGNITISPSNFPTEVGGVILEAEDWGGFTVTWPVGTMFAGGAAPTFTTSGTDLVSMVKDAGDVYWVQVIDQDYQPV